MPSFLFLSVVSDRITFSLPNTACLSLSRSQSVVNMMWERGGERTDSIFFRRNEKKRTGVVKDQTVLGRGREGV